MGDLIFELKSEKSAADAGRPCLCIGNDIIKISIADPRCPDYTPAEANDAIFNFSNLLMKSPIDYSLVERRFFYKLAEEVKRKYYPLHLGNYYNWKDLYLYMSAETVMEIGGVTNVKRTVDVISDLSNKKLTQYCFDEGGVLCLNGFHWINSFRFDSEAEMYKAEVSPYMFSYMIGQKRNFTRFNLAQGMKLKSKYSQKFFELACLFTGNPKALYRERKVPKKGYVYKPGVLGLSTAQFRIMFGISNFTDPKTGTQLVSHGKYDKFRQIEDNIIIPSREELYSLYKSDQCDAWFDYSVQRAHGSSTGRITSVYLYFYSKRWPKSTDPGLDCPQEGDEELCPIEAGIQPTAVHAGLNDSVSDMWIKEYLSRFIPSELVELNISRRNAISEYLRMYFEGNEVSYYIGRIDDRFSTDRACYNIAVYELTVNEHSDEFNASSKDAKRVILEEVVFKENLKKYGGWSIPAYMPPFSKKDVK